MVLDMCAHPPDRKNTPEEIAPEEREELEQLEEECQKQMVAVDEENDNAGKPLTQRPTSISGDTLDEELKTIKGFVDEILARKDAGDSENEGSSEDSESAEDGGDSSQYYDKKYRTLCLKD